MGDLHSKLCIIIYTVSSLLLDCTLRKECLEIFVVLDIDITVSLTNLLTSMNELKSYSNFFLYIKNVGNPCPRSSHIQLRYLHLAAGRCHVAPYLVSLSYTT